LQRLLAQAQMRFLLINAGLDFPAFMITQDPFIGRRLVRVQQGGD
jgi:hypothetical protein